MKKILFFILLSMSVTCFGQETQSIDSIQTTEADSIHAGSHTFSDTKLEDVTKAEGDSAYIKADYATAIQIYESLLKNGESADVYYNLGNSYYKAGEIAKAVLNYERALLMKPGNSDIRVRMSISRLTVSWLAGAKVADISIHSKHICLFFETFLKQFRKWLIDKDVVEHKFERENERSWKGVHYYICVRV